MTVFLVVHPVTEDIADYQRGENVAAIFSTYEDAENYINGMRIREGYAYIYADGSEGDDYPSDYKLGESVHILEMEVN